jgi:hypothetical protein
MNKSPSKVQKYKYGKNYNKSDHSQKSYKNKPTTKSKATDGRYASPKIKATDGRYASPKIKTTDGRYDRPRKPDERSYRNAVNLGQRIKVQNKRKKLKK